jgi:hypothetical protein
MISVNGREELEDLMPAKYFGDYKKLLGFVGVEAQSF